MCYLISSLESALYKKLFSVCAWTSCHAYGGQDNLWEAVLYNMLVTGMELR